MTQRKMQESRAQTRHPSACNSRDNSNAQIPKLGIGPTSAERTSNPSSLLPRSNMLDHLGSTLPLSRGSTMDHLGSFTERRGGHGLEHLGSTLERVGSNLERRSSMERPSSMLERPARDKAKRRLSSVAFVTNDPLPGGPPAHDVPPHFLSRRRGLSTSFCADDMQLPPPAAGAAVVAAAPLAPRGRPVLNLAPLMPTEGSPMRGGGGGPPLSASSRGGAGLDRAGSGASSCGPRRSGARSPSPRRIVTGSKVSGGSRDQLPRCPPASPRFTSLNK